MNNVQGTETGMKFNNFAAGRFTIVQYMDILK